MSELKTLGSLDQLFSASIDDLADLPAFEAPPPGAYLLRVSCDVKKINDKDAVEAAFTVVETVELEDPEHAKPVANGTKFSQAFLLENEFGVGNLKKFLSPFSQHFGASNIGALLQEIKEVEIAASIKNRKDKNDPEKVYASVTNITVS
jgi:hypothetical protein